MLMPAPVASPDEKSHVANNFDCLYLKNVMVLLTMPSVSCDAYADVSGITDQNSNVAPHFDSSDLRNAMVPLMMLSVSCDANAKDITQPKVILHLISIIMM